MGNVWQEGKKANRERVFFQLVSAIVVHTTSFPAFLVLSCMRVQLCVYVCMLKVSDLRLFKKNKKYVHEPYVSAMFLALNRTSSVEPTLINWIELRQCWERQKSNQSPLSKETIVITVQYPKRRPKDHKPRSCHAQASWQGNSLWLCIRPYY